MPPNSSKSPLVSVVIPAFNAEKTIKKTLESVLNQSLHNIEIIIVNDSSTDSTAALISEYDDARIKLFHHNAGNTSKSRNKGIQNASGEYIAFLDADDLWLPNKLAMQLQALQQSNTAKVAYCWVNCIDSQGEFIRKSNRFKGDGNVYEELLVHNFLGNGSNPLIRSSSLSEIGNFDESLAYAEDRDLYLRLAHAYDFVAVPSVLVLYRISHNSKSFRNLLESESSYARIMAKACSLKPESAQILVKKGFPNYYGYIIRRALNSSRIKRKRVIAFKLFIRFVCKRPGVFKNLRTKYRLFLLLMKSFRQKLNVKSRLKKLLSYENFLLSD